VEKQLNDEITHDSQLRVSTLTKKTGMQNIITVSCSICGSELRINCQALGRTAVCPKCQCTIQLPKREDVVAIEKRLIAQAAERRAANRIRSVLIASLVICLFLAAVYGLYKIVVPYSSNQEKTFKEFVAILVDTPKTFAGIKDKDSADVADRKLQDYEDQLPLLQKEIDDMPQRAKMSLARKYENEIRESNNAFGEVFMKSMNGSLNPHASGVMQRHMFIFAKSSGHKE
jgi:hypothetical protein